MAQTTVSLQSYIWALEWPLFTVVIIMIFKDYMDAKLKMLQGHYTRQWSERKLHIVSTVRIVLMPSFLLLLIFIIIGVIIAGHHYWFTAK